jgi:glycosyltransferase involved in cell wall biosynthesis
MDRPRVSVCIPTYNRYRYLREAIESALAQTFADFELLVVDNCSTDETPALVAAYAARDARVRYVRNERNLGLVGNFLRCVELARGEYVALLHDDDVYLPEMLAATSAALAAHPAAAFAYGAAEEMDDVGGVVGLRRWRIGDTVLEPPAAFAHLLAFNSVPPPGILVRASAYAAVGGYDPAMAPAIDWDLWLRMARRFPVVYVDRVLARYRLTAESCTTEVERDGSLAVSMRRVVERAVAAYPGARRPPRHIVRRGRLWVGRYELSVASLFLYQGQLDRFRRHTIAALRFAPELLATRPGLAMVTLSIASLAGWRGPQAVWRVLDRLGRLSGPADGRVKRVPPPPRPADEVGGRWVAPARAGRD